MSLPALHHRKLTTVTAVSNGVVDMLNAIWDAVQPSVTTYIDGTTRVFTAGGTGWTWSRYQLAGVTQAVYASPPNGSLAQRIIIAGATTTPTPSPTMIIDTYLANRLYMGINKNSGVFASWNAALPFTSGQWSGYVALATATPLVPLAFSILETEETVQIGVLTGSAGAMYGAGLGALIDPDTGDAVDAESDGRVYGMWTVGTSTLATAMLGAAVINVFMGHGGSATNAHFLTFTPSTSTMVATLRETVLNSQTAAMRTTRAGRFPATVMYATCAANWCGRIREMRIIRPASFGQRVDAAGVNKGYVFSFSTLTGGDSVLMEY
jgi:hypothetical protein